MKKILEAVQKLKDKGWKVEKHKDGWLAASYGQGFHDYREDWIYSDRELINLSKIFCRKGPWNKTIKEETHKPFRRKARQQIAAQNLEDFNLDKRMSKNNPWRYD